MLMYVSSLWHQHGGQFQSQYKKNNNKVDNKPNVPISLHNY